MSTTAVLRRFRLPVGIAPAVCAVLAAVLLGGLGSAVCARLVLDPTSRLPSDADARQVAALVLGRPYDGPLSRGGPVPYSLDADVPAGAPVGDWTAAQAEARLTAAGWKVASGGLGWFAADRDGLHADVGGPPVHVAVTREKPVSVTVQAVLGWLLGAVLGWLLAGRVWRAVAGGGVALRLRQATLAVLGGGGLLLIVQFGLWGYGAGPQPSGPRVALGVLCLALAAAAARRPAEAPGVAALGSLDGAGTARR